MNVENITSKHPKLDLIIGCMFSGKTTELMNRIRKAHLIYSPSHVLVINHRNDTRYNDDARVCSHDKQNVNAISVEHLNSIMTTYEFARASMVFVDEGQFFSDLKDFALAAVEKHGKWVTVCGLDGDYQRNRFGQLIDLVRYADTVHKTTALCLECKDGTPALFSARIEPMVSSQNGDEAGDGKNGREQTVVGAQDKYIPVCRKHYLSRSRV